MSYPRPTMAPRKRSFVKCSSFRGTGRLADHSGLDPISYLKSRPCRLNLQSDPTFAGLELRNRPIRPTIDMLETEPEQGPVLEQIPSVRTRPDPRNLGRTRFGASDCPDRIPTLPTTTTTTATIRTSFNPLPDLFTR